MRKIIFLLFLAACGSVNAPPTSESPDTTPTYPDDAAVVDGSAPDALSPTDASVVDSSQPGDGAIPHCGDMKSKCQDGDYCRSNADCLSSICSYAGVCIVEPSCAGHFGGDTCGKGEIGSADAVHESCCTSLPVVGFNDTRHPGKTVYLDKYEITSGRVRVFIEDITKRMGKPNVRGWITANKPAIWNDAWSAYLPTDVDGDSITINRLLLGDPRHDGETNPGPGVIVPPAVDQVVNLGLNYQFSGTVYADVHGNNCGTYPNSYGFPTYWYPDAVVISNGEVPRTLTKDLLDTKSMNCITNAMLAAFCAWDGGQLATNEVINFVTASPVDRPDNVSGCGTQYDNHGDLLGDYFGRTVQKGGKCADVELINATFDAGDNLPFPYPASILNKHNYMYPYMNVTSDKVWQIAAPGRVTIDNVDGWMDLAGNLSESVINTTTGRFGLKGRGIGYGSARSDLNVLPLKGEDVLRIHRPEVKSALSGGRCMRFK